jgi:hypothetical protein
MRWTSLTCGSGRVECERRCHTLQLSLVIPPMSSDASVGSSMSYQKGYSQQDMVMRMA